MKSTKTKLIAGVGLLGLGTVLWSFGTADEPKFKRYEVVRSVNGQVTTYDTIVDVASGFTPQQYLDQLGFSGDEKINILELPYSHEVMIQGHRDHPMLYGCDSMKIVKIEMDGGQHTFEADGHQMIVIDHFGAGMPADSIHHVNITINEENGELGSEEGQVMIRKNIVVKTVDSLDHEMVQLEELVELIHLDSLMRLHHQLNELDSTMIFVHEVMIDGNEKPADHQDLIEIHTIHGDPEFERHVQHGDHRMDMEVFSEGGDFTLVIVSDVQPEEKSPVNVEKSNDPAGTFKVYPNPASKEVAVQLNFAEKAKTLIVVSDAKGNTVMQLDLGDFSGSHNQTIDVSKWAKGIYFVNIERPGTRMVEKLVIE